MLQKISLWKLLGLLWSFVVIIFVVVVVIVVVSG